MKTPKCEFCMTKVRNRKIEPGHVFCMTLWREVDPDETCWDCDSNADAVIPMVEQESETDNGNI